MVASVEVATPGICGKIRGVQRICEYGVEAVPATILKVVELTREAIKMRRMNTTMSNRPTDLETKLVDIGAAGRTMRCQIMATQYLI